MPFDLRLVAISMRCRELLIPSMARVTKVVGFIFAGAIRRIGTLPEWLTILTQLCMERFNNVVNISSYWPFNQINHFSNGYPVTVMWGCVHFTECGENVEKRQNDN